MFPEGKEAIFLAMQELVVTMFEREIAAAVAGREDEVEIIRGYIRASAQGLSGLSQGDVGLHEAYRRSRPGPFQGAASKAGGSVPGLRERGFGGDTERHGKRPIPKNESRGGDLESAGRDQHLVDRTSGGRLARGAGGMYRPDIRPVFYWNIE